MFMFYSRIFNSLPGYGTLPLVTSSVSRIPKDQTSDFIVNFPYRAASGAVHLIGNLAPEMQRNTKKLLNIQQNKIKTDFVK